MPTAFRELNDQIHHRFLRGDVQSGRRLICDQQLRIAGQRQCDDHALAHAAGQLERIGVIAFARPRNAHLFECLDRLLAAICRCRLDVLAQNVFDLVAVTLRMGLSANRGDWKIIEISRPRRSRI